MHPWMTSTYRNADGTTETLASAYPGKVILVINTASRCGFTPQYAELEQIYNDYKDQGFVVVAFPSNDFGSQEPGTDKEIKTFCSTTYSVTFPLKSKVPTKGSGKSPLYAALTGDGTPEPGVEIRWNFEKHLIGRDGGIIARYRSSAKPSSKEVKAAIETALAAKAS